jgi:predicted RNA-binding protein with PUA-like domain
MRYWLMKTEPAVFSFEDLGKRPHKTDHWEGVRNYQARNYMKDEMEKGDPVLFYHSNCAEPGVVGIAEITREAYPDYFAWDRNSRYFDPKATPENPRWCMVDVTWKKAFRRTVTLKDLKAEPKLRDMKVLRKGQRLSIMPVTRAEFERVSAMGMREET